MSSSFDVTGLVVLALAIWGLIASRRDARK